MSVKLNVIIGLLVGLLIGWYVGLVAFHPGCGQAASVSVSQQPAEYSGRLQPAANVYDIQPTRNALQAADGGVE